MNQEKARIKKNLEDFGFAKRKAKELTSVIQQMEKDLEWLTLNDRKAR